MAKTKTPAKKAATKKTKTRSEDKHVSISAEGEVVQSPPDQQPAPESAVATIPEAPDREAALSIVGGISTAELKQALDTQTEQRKLIQKFIADNLVEGVDYGKIHVVKNCAQENQSRGSCDKDYHFSKSILFKPGQEKIFSLFGITDELEKDLDAYEMLAGVPGLVAYKCTMWRGKNKVGEGRGAATLAGTQSDPNSTIKKAEKRARMDACLSLGFSAYFTQDLDDPEYAAQREMMNSKAAAEAERRDKDEFGLMPRDPDLPIDNSERATLHRILIKSGFSDPDEILELLKVNGVSDPQSMTSGEARTMMGKVAHSMFSAPVMPEKPKDVVIEDIGDGPIELPDVDAGPPVPPEPELVVDEELKNEVAQRAESISLNARGRMWLMQRIAGKPFAKFENFTDEQWRTAYQVVQGILDSVIDVDESHINGYVAPDEAEEPSDG